MLELWSVLIPSEGNGKMTSDSAKVHVDDGFYGRNKQ